MTGLAQNLRFGLRQLRRNPGFTATMIITLAIAIGANTAIFSIATGRLVGIGLCAGVLRVMRSVLYGVTVYDAPTMLSVVAVLASVALIASSLPTPRIARIDPAQTLREE
jgi:ABC-type antimicrobial peptide transport system permease subunit